MGLSTDMYTIRHNNTEHLLWMRLGVATYLTQVRSYVALAPSLKGSSGLKGSEMIVGNVGIESVTKQLWMHAQDIILKKTKKKSKKSRNCRKAVSLTHCQICKVESCLEIAECLYPDRRPDSA